MGGLVKSTNLRLESSTPLIETFPKRYEGIPKPKLIIIEPQIEKQ